MSALGFRIELEKLINRESMENGSNTPDFVLCIYLEGCLRVFDAAVMAREKYYGRDVLSLQKSPSLETPAEWAEHTSKTLRTAPEVCAQCGIYPCQCLGLNR